MIIEEHQGFWRALFFPEARDIETVDKWDTDGYRAVIGEVEGKYTPKYVDYSKDKFTLDRVLKLAPEGSRACPICKSLNSQVDVIEKIIYMNDENKDKDKDMSKESTDVFKDVMMPVFFNALFTRPGRFLIGSMLGDEKLLSKVVPTDEEEMLDFVSELADFFAGKVDLVRSPEDVSSYARMFKRKKRGVDDGQGVVSRIDSSLLMEVI